VVGRGLRRRTYELAANGLMTEEVAKVFGVPFQVIPFKATARKSRPSQNASRACGAARAQLEIRVRASRGIAGDSKPRVGGRNAVAPLWLDPAKIPPEVQVKASLPPIPAVPR